MNEKAIAYSRFKFGADDESLRITRRYPFWSTLLVGVILVYLGVSFGFMGYEAWLALLDGELTTTQALIAICLGFGTSLAVVLYVLKTIRLPIAVDVNSQRAVLRTHFRQREYRLDSVSGLNVERFRTYHMAEIYGSRLFMCLSNGRQILLVDLPTLDASTELQKIVVRFEEITGRNSESQEDSRR